MSSPDENIQDESTDELSEEGTQEDDIDASSEESAENIDENQSSWFESWEIPSFSQLLGYK